MDLHPQHAANRPSFPQLAMRILVVEDYAPNQRLVQKLLEKFGCAVDIASNGIEAINLVEPNKYDIILMDCQMPEMDGFEATSLIRKKFPNETIIIIAMTANALNDDRKICLEAGMDDYIAKPFKPIDMELLLLKWQPKVII